VHFAPTSARPAATDFSIRKRFVCLAAALLFVAAQVQDLVHLAHARHAPCVEHGGMCHLEGEADAALVPDALVVFAPEWVPLVGRPSERGDHGREDCQTCAREREHGLSALVVVVRSPEYVTAYHPPGIGRGRSALDQAGLWRLAAKRGPPVAG